MTPAPAASYAQGAPEGHDAASRTQAWQNGAIDTENFDSESQCDPYLNFDGMTTGSMDNRSMTNVTAPRSMRSSASIAESNIDSIETDATSLLPALQAKGAGDDSNLEPLYEDEIDPASFDLIAPSGQDPGVYSLEKRSELLFSKEHLGAILSNPRLLGQFTNFLSTTRPGAVPLLSYYLDTEKALRAIKYANAVAGSLKELDGHDFTSDNAEDLFNKALQAKHDAAFEALTRDELPMFITHIWIQIVSLSIKRRIVGSLPNHLRDASEGLAEVFCLTDPSRHDNPIILASDEFHRTTQYGINYAIGRNCRFLQGPGTNPFSVKRIRDRLTAGQEHFETFLNYRRDGSPFLNLLLCAPLIDSRGTVRYFLGAQVDVSGLAKECSGLEGLRQMVEEESQDEEVVRTHKTENPAQGTTKTPAECCKDLSEMFDRTEIDTVRRHGGAMHQKIGEDGFYANSEKSRDQPYVVIDDAGSPEHYNEDNNEEDHVPTTPTHAAPEIPRHVDPRSNGRLAGVYEHYLLVRPAPNLRILFASPSLRVPGMLQSPFLNRIGGSGRVRDQIEKALGEGHGVTARVRWLSSSRRTQKDDRGRPRWLHCTPLRGVNGSIGIWMMVIVDEDRNEFPANGSVTAPAQQGSYKPQYKTPQSSRQPKLAPPIAPQVNGRQLSYYSATGSRRPSLQSQHRHEAAPFGAGPV